MTNKYPIIDLHEDLFLHMSRRDLFPKGEWQTNPDMIRDNKLKLVVATAFPVPENENFFDPVVNKMIEHEFDSYNDLIKKEKWSLIQTAVDIDLALKPESSVSLLLHIEGLNVIDDQSWDQLERWNTKGWRSLGIVWNLSNPLGGGANDSTQELTQLGADIIRWCQNKRMIVDLAHMNEQTFWDATKIIDRPLYVSHGNCRSLCDSPRNYSDDQLRAIAKTDGVIGIFFAKTYITGREKPAKIKDVVAHIEHARKIVGEDSVALGTDFGGIINGFPDGLGSLNSLSTLFEALAEEGWTDEMLEKLCYKNAARVLKTYL
jgi:membrane dipeptidase